tara:strand:- start:478 stop:972 length:495 start_codon:yes stop_codon:yes gene_type:complete
MSTGVPIGGPLGLEIPVVEFRAINRTDATLTVGDVLMIDMGGTAGEVSGTDNTVAGASDAGLSNVVAPTDNLAVGVGILCVALEATTDNSTGRFLLQGRTTAKTSEAINNLGAALTVDNSSTALSDTGGVNQGFFAYALEETSGAGTAQVLFNGFGWGNQASSD